jgi:activator of 2-hydroxyglutaryl-CoA dehydratase
MFTMGIDIGTVSSKAVILEDGEKICARTLVPAGTGSSGPRRVVEEALRQSGLSRADIGTSLVTGCGRFSFEEADDQVSEISCHARGVFFLVPDARTIIDIGGRDVKVVSLGDRGMVQKFFLNDTCVFSSVRNRQHRGTAQKFFMNGKCATGTGRFLEVMARVMDLSLEEMGDIHFTARNPAELSSTCTVYAESEVISLFSKGIPREDIVAGVHASVAAKAVALTQRVGLKRRVVMCGGVARNPGVVYIMSDLLDEEVEAAPEPQLTGALGAALLAFEGKNQCREIVVGGICQP